MRLLRVVGILMVLTGAVVVCLADAGAATPTPTPTTAPTCDAETLPSSVPLSLSGSTSSSGANFSASCPEVIGAGPERAYSFVPPFTGLYRIDTEGSAIDTVLYLRGGSCNGEQSACDDDSGEGASSAFDVLLQAGTVYLVFVDSFSSAGGDFALHIAPVGTPTPTATPRVVISASSVAAGPGQTAQVGFAIEGLAPEEAGDMEFSILFDPMVLAVDPDVDCTKAPRLGSYTFGHSLMAAPPGRQRLRLLLVDLSAPFDSIVDGPLASCAMHVLPGAPDGDSALEVTQIDVGDVEGNPLPLPVRGANGSVHVLAGGASPTMAMPSPTATSLPSPSPTIRNCFGDCDRDGQVTSSDFGRVLDAINLCGPCAGSRRGGLAAGCPASPEGCPAADFDGDGCLTASDLTRLTGGVAESEDDCPPPAPVALCGNGMKEQDESCDDGNNFGGDGCAANCTAETDFTIRFGDDSTSDSELILQGGAFGLDLVITGSRVMTRGAAGPRATTGADGMTNFTSNEIPLSLVMAKNTGRIEPIKVPGLFCGCARGVELQTCGGRPVLPGQTSPVCNTDAAGSVDFGRCPVGDPCKRTYGPGGFGAGRIELAEASMLDYLLSANHSGGAVTFQPGGGPINGGVVVSSFVSIGFIQDDGSCSFDAQNSAKGADGIPCTDDDSVSSRGLPTVMVETTGTAEIRIVNVNGQPGSSIDTSSMCGAAPCRASASGHWVSGESLLAGNTNGFCLGSGSVALGTPVFGDTVMLTRLCGIAP